MGSVGQNENGDVASRTRYGNRVQLTNFPDVDASAIEQLATAVGTVLNFNLVTESEERQAVVSYETAEQAQSAVEQLNGQEFQGQKIEAKLLEQNGGRQRRFEGGAARFNSSNNSNNLRNSSLPLRILVPSELVGAVIGKKGVTIRNITTQCKARVDVHGKDNAGLVEKMISIFGPPDNCNSACKEILQVMHTEPAAESRGGIVPLKMLIDDRYCGRIIGKEGKIIKKIRDDTSTKITISSVQEMAVVYPDRVITIIGTIDSMVAAQSAISAKLAECMERDMQSTNGLGNLMMMSAGGAAPVMSGIQYSQRQYGAPVGGYTSAMYPPAAVSNQIDVCQIVVPDRSVGAIIGSGGSMIKQIMEDSGAHVTVEAKKEGDATSGSSLERIVTIRGNTDAIWKASYFVFEKVKDESSSAASGGGDSGELKLRTLLSVPRTVAGRIIGRQGKNVREVQRMTGATVKLTDSSAGNGNEVIAEVYGNFMATQGAHARIRALIADDSIDMSAPYPPMEVAPPTGPRSFGPRRAIQQQA